MASTPKVGTPIQVKVHFDAITTLGGKMAPADPSTAVLVAQLGTGSKDRVVTLQRIGPVGDWFASWTPTAAGAWRLWGVGSGAVECESDPVTIQVKPRDT